MGQKKSEFLAIITLFLAAAMWGFSFVAQSKAAEKIGPFTVNFIRFALGGLIVLGLTLFYEKRSEKKVQHTSWLNREFQKAVAISGLILAVIMGLQQAAMGTSTAGNGGFITNMDVLILPLLTVFVLKKSVSRAVWLAVALALVGLYLISFSNPRFAIGDILLLGVAFFVAIKGLLIGDFVKKFAPLRLASATFLVAGFSSGCLALIFEIPGTTSQEIVSIIWPLIYLTVFCTAIAYLLEILSHTELDPVKVSFVLNVEAIFAAFGGWWLLNESFDIRTTLGCGLVFIAILITTFAKSIQDDPRDSTIENHTIELQS